MAFIVIFLISLIPGLLWVRFFYRRDRYDKEPLKLILLVFAFGMAAVVPAALWEAPFRDLLANPPNAFVHLLATILIIGAGEETLKLLAVYVTVFHHPEFNEPADGIIYAVTASLGFASLENAFYTVAYGLSVAPIRAIVTTLAHASFGGVAGLYLGMAKFDERVGWQGVAGGLAIAAGLHGVYDFVIMSQVVHPLFSLIFIYATYRFVDAKLRHLVAHSPFQP